MIRGLRGLAWDGFMLMRREPWDFHFIYRNSKWVKTWKRNICKNKIGTQIDSEILQRESELPGKHQPRPCSNKAAQCSLMVQAQSAEQCVLNRLSHDFPGPLPLTEALPQTANLKKKNPFLFLFFFPVLGLLLRTTLSESGGTGLSASFSFDYEA